MVITRQETPNGYKLSMKLTPAMIRAVKEMETGKWYSLADLKAIKRIMDGLVKRGCAETKIDTSQMKAPAILKRADIMYRLLDSKRARRLLDV